MVFSSKTTPCELLLGPLEAVMSGDVIKSEHFGRARAKQARSRVRVPKLWSSDKSGPLPRHEYHAQHGLIQIQTDRRSARRDQL